jgi:hypothetical protein
MAEGLVWLAVLALIVVAFRSIADRPTRVGSASAGTVYDWLNQDKRKAIEIVVDGQAERQDGEHAEGNLPDLEDPAAAEPRDGSPREPA